MITIKKERVLVRPKDLIPSSNKFKILGTFNPAAVRMENGDILLYVRVFERLKITEDENYHYSPRYTGKKKCVIRIDKFKKELITDSSDLDMVFKDETKRLKFISHFRRVVLDRTGFKVKSIEKKPSFLGLTNDGEFGVEDPRITKIDDKYIMTYVTLSQQGNISTSYAISTDLYNWERKGIIFREQNKDIVIFPEKIKGKYIALNRPEGNFQFSPPHISLSRSKDLQYWGKPSSLQLAKKGNWDYGRVGAGPPPIKTDKGWLVIYHGVVEHEQHPPEKSFLEKIKDIFGKHEEEIGTVSVYSAGAALLDLQHPSRITAKTPQPIIVPRKKFEKSFEGKYVIFPTGAVMDENGQDILLFCGAGDTSTVVKKISLKDIMDSMKKIS